MDQHDEAVGSGSDPERGLEGAAGSDLTRLEVELPLDRGFLRRRCPNCAREFKRLGSNATGANVTVAACVCPYCYESSPPDEWWTPDQRRYVIDVARDRVVNPSLRRFQREIEDLDLGGLVTLSLTGVESPPPLARSEPADMTRIGFPCHPEEPLRVVEEWGYDVACHACGLRYPLRDVAAQDPT